MSPGKSAVWNHFVKVDKTTARCKLCNATIKTSGNTSNLWTHLEKHNIYKSGKKTPSSREREDPENNSEEVDDCQEVVGNSAPSESTPNVTVALLGKRKATGLPPGTEIRAKQATLAESLTRSKSFEAGGSKALALDDAYLYMVMKDNLPLVSGQKDGFKRFCKIGIPLWSPPKRDRTTSMMETKYEKVSDLVKNALAQLPSVCLTADNWTEKHSTNSFLGVTVHFPLGTEMESVILALQHLDESHTSEYLETQFRKVLDDWKIDTRRVSLCVTDNAGNIKKCVRDIFGNDRVVGCFDHTLNLIPKAALGYKKVNRVDVPNVPGVPEIMKRVKKIVTFSHQSVKFSDELKHLQYERGKTQGTALRLLQDCPTRWGSSYLMLARYIDMSEIVTLASFKTPGDVEVLSPADVATLKAIRDILQPFHSVTKEMSAEKQTTASKVIPIVSLLRQALEKVEVPTHDDLARRFRKFILDEFDNRFEHIESVLPLAIATLVDPRFQLTYFKNIGATARVRNCVEDKIKKLIRDEIRARETGHATEGVNQAPPPQAQRETNAIDLWGDHDAMVAAAHANMAVDDAGGQARTELRSFLQRHPAPRTCNPLEVWESIKLEYPHLYEIARAHLPMLATSVPSERCFSGAGRIMTDDGNRLSAEHLAQRLFMANVSDRIWNEAK